MVKGKRIRQGNIVKVPFPFTEDPSLSKQRPALVIFPGTDMSILAFMTTQISQIRNHPFNVGIKMDGANGLKKDSFVVLEKITTLDNNLIRGLYGNLAPKDLMEVKKVITAMFGI